MNTNTVVQPITANPAPTLAVAAPVIRKANPVNPEAFARYLTATRLGQPVKGILTAPISEFDLTVEQTDQKKAARRANAAMVKGVQRLLSRKAFTPAGFRLGAKSGSGSLRFAAASGKKAAAVKAIAGFYASHK